MICEFKRETQKFSLNESISSSFWSRKGRAPRQLVFRLLWPNYFLTKNAQRNLKGFGRKSVINATKINTSDHVLSLSGHRWCFDTTLKSEIYKVTEVSCIDMSAKLIRSQQHLKTEIRPKKTAEILRFRIFANIRVNFWQLDKIQLNRFK